jgi:LysM domain
MVRARCVVPVLLFLIALPLIGAPKKSSTRPPRDLHRVGDHWTPYNPPDPATFPPESKVYTIVKGDTLWDLGKKFYGNAYLWPQLWEANTYITDAHWIYPGDPLLVQGETVSGETGTTTTVGSGTGAPSQLSARESAGATGGEQGTAASTAAAATTGTPIALGVESDIYCYGYLGDLDENLPNRIAAFEDIEEKYEPSAQEQSSGVAVDEILFIDGGSSTGLKAGDTYLVVMPHEVVYHPKTRAVLGRHYDFRGRVRILCATETRATAVVTQACKDIHVGDRLKPLADIPIPLARLTPMANVCSAPSGKTAGFIVNAQDYYYALGEGHVVEINLGRDDLVQPGDFLTVFRESPTKSEPRQVLGEIGVLTAEAHSATAKIVRMRYDMQVGDLIELK